jgi:S1-C subfamily serine protease
VTDGRVSGLLGPEEDTRIIQVTTPVQGGSSGGPLFDAKGRVIGVVTAMLMGAQSVNFAVRGTLAQAIVEAAGKSVELGADGPDLDIAAVARATRESVWRLEARQ